MVPAICPAMFPRAPSRMTMIRDVRVPVESRAVAAKSVDRGDLALAKSAGTERGKTQTA